MEQLIQGIHHIAMRCEKPCEMEKVLHFYCEILGLKVRSQSASCTMIDAGNALLEVFPEGESIKKKGAILHIAFQTERVSECIEAVRAAGYEVIMEPREVPGLASIAFCIGPLGEEIEFFRPVQ